MISRKPVGVTISTLEKQTNKSIIENIVRNQVRLIDARIVEANQAGFDRIDYELPVSFVVKNMTREESQTWVYSELLETYMNPESAGGKGFTHTYLSGTGVRPYLTIHWVNGLSEGDRRRRKQMIADRWKQQ
jgi:hypothetical protein